MSLQLTSGSGGRTFHEAALRLNQEVENLTLLSYSYSITGISKPVDKVECTKQMHLKLSANLIIRGGGSGGAFRRHYEAEWLRAASR